MKNLVLACVALFYSVTINPDEVKIITHFQSAGSKDIALTFDACQRKIPAYFDEKILNCIIEKKLPVTIFLSGEFAIQNRVKITRIAKTMPFIEFENHSLHHYNRMDRMSDSQLIREIKETQKIIRGQTGREPLFFRFPAGNCNQHALEIVHRLGLKTVHWSFASGDVSKKESAKDIADRINKRTRPGNILIFHINGRGWNTGSALPTIINDLKAKGYNFVKLDEVIK
jgi:peptidoglycan-N-acetylglucosamine deacetylase